MHHKTIRKLITEGKPVGKEGFGEYLGRNGKQERKEIYERICIANLISINLNKNIIESSEDPNYFPRLPLERDIFVDDNSLNARLKELWSAIFNRDDLCKKDIAF